MRSDLGDVLVGWPRKGEERRRNINLKYLINFNFIMIIESSYQVVPEDRGSRDLSNETGFG